ncbi:MAG: ATP-binding protein [Nitrospira sp.]|nr:ATP-binding protein [Nitrospira sp.]
MTDFSPPHINTAPETTESLRHLREFLQDIGEIPTLPLLAERLLTELLRRTHGRQGWLYLLDQERTGLYHLTTDQSDQPDQLKATPRTLTLSHPLVHELAHRHEILDRRFSPHDTDGHVSLNTSDFIGCSLAIPFVNRGRLLAFAILQSDSNISAFYRENTDLLRIIAQSGASSLDCLLNCNDLHSSQELTRRADRLRSLETLAGGFAHEIRNPLTSIKTFIQLTPERKDDAEFIREFSQVVLGDVRRIERLIDEILGYARSMEPQLAEEDINTAVSSCLYLLDAKARDRGIMIQKDLASELPRVMLDQQQIKQALLNLFTNALDAMGDRGGTLLVKTHAIERWKGRREVQVDIADTGHGIPAADLERIFDPFYTTKHKSSEHEGTGLGLFIAHQIIREHQGTIHVQSTEGAGTVFRITLPSVG